MSWPPLPLAEQMAIDLACSALGASADPVEPMLVIASTSPAAVAVLTRMSGPLVVAAESQAVVDEARAELAKGAHPRPGDVDVVTLDDAARAGRTYRQAMWLVPSSAGVSQLPAIDRLVADGGKLAIVGSGPLRRIRSGTRGWAPGLTEDAGDPLGLGRGLAYRVETERRLYGVRSALWALAGVVARRAARQDLADRCEAGYRLALEDGRRPRLWSVGVWVGRKPN